MDWCRVDSVSLWYPTGKEILDFLATWMVHLLLMLSRRSSFTVPGAYTRPPWQLLFSEVCFIWRIFFRFQRENNPTSQNLLSYTWNGHLIWEEIRCLLCAYFGPSRIIFSRRHVPCGQAPSRKEGSTALNHRILRAFDPNQECGETHPICQNYKYNLSIRVLHSNNCDGFIRIIFWILKLS